MSRNRAVGIVAVVVIVLGAVVVGGMAMRGGGTKRDALVPMLVPVARAATQPTTPAEGGLRVGVYLSNWSRAASGRRR